MTDTTTWGFPELFLGCHWCDFFIEDPDGASLWDIHVNSIGLASSDGSFLETGSENATDDRACRAESHPAVTDRLAMIDHGTALPLCPFPPRDKKPLALDYPFDILEDHHSLPCTVEHLDFRTPIRLFCRFAFSGRHKPDGVSGHHVHGKNSPKDAIFLDRMDTLGVGPTSRCNVACAYCAYPHSGPNTSHMPQSIVDKLVTLDGFGLKRVYFCGHGEPSLHPSFWEFVSAYSQQGVITELNTNGYVLTHDIDRLAVYGLNHIHLSMPGGTASVYNRLMRGNNFDRIIRGLGELKQMQGKSSCAPPRVSRLIAIGSTDCMETLPDVCRIASRFGIPTVFLHSLAETTAFAKNKSILHDFTPHRQFLLRSIRSAAKNGVDLIPDFAISHALKHDNDSVDREGCFTSPGAGETLDCIDPWTRMEILQNGKARTCGYPDPANFFNISDEQFLWQIWNHDYLVNIRRMLLSGDLAAPCSTCNCRGPIKVSEFRKKVERLLRLL